MPLTVQRRSAVPQKSLSGNRRKPARQGLLPASHNKQLKYNRSIQIRWSSLLLVAVIAFIVLSNTQSRVSDAKDGDGMRQKPHALANDQNSRHEKQKANQRLALSHPKNAIHRLERKIPIRPTASADTDREKSQYKGEKEKWVVRPGDTLSGILDHFNAHSALSEILASPDHKPLLKLLPGNVLELFINQGQLMAIHCYKNAKRRNYWSLSRQSNNHFLFADHQLETEWRQAHAFGVVDSSFYAAGLEAGLSDKTIVNVANVLAWDLDFILQVRSQDYFSVIYEEEFLDGEKIGDGKVLGVDFYNNGKTYRAIRYTPINGQADYYTPKGKIMRKAFLRAPLPFPRVTSHFNPRRLHPIHNDIRPHRGVDYGAAIGTKIWATGDGRIKFRGWKQGYGNTVIIQHAGIYSTLYAHLSKFAANQKVNSRVKQKQVIGYVGKTGWATGPHLHYEFRVHGVHKDPVRVKLPDAKSLPKREIPRFTKTIADIHAQLDVLNKIAAANQVVSQ